jgi:sugar phosphate isomerase/epimerase
MSQVRRSPSAIAEKDVSKYQRHMNYVTLGYTTVYASPSETIDAARAAGFDSVGIRITGRRPDDPDIGLVGHKTAIREFRNKLDDLGLRLSNVSTYHFHPELHVADLLPVLDATAELGASFMVASSYDPHEERYVEKLARCSEAAARLGIRVSLEFIPYSAAKTIGQARDLVKRTGQSNAGILVDSLHLDRSGGTPADIVAVEPELIHFAQICDACAERPSSAEALRAEAIGGRLYPADGVLPLHEFLDALPPGTEIECELPNAALGLVSVDERARRAGTALREFLARHRDR